MVRRVALSCDGRQVSKLGKVDDFMAPPVPERYSWTNLSTWTNTVLRSEQLTYGRVVCRESDSHGADRMYWWRMRVLSTTAQERVPKQGRCCCNFFLCEGLGSRLMRFLLGHGGSNPAAGPH
eukprot:4082954-Amphidinium_carterae.1